MDKCQKESKNELNSGSYNQSISARMLEVDAEPQIAPYVYILSSSGPRQDPWGTPHSKWKRLDKVTNTQSPSATKFWRELVLRRFRNTSLSMECSQRNAMVDGISGWLGPKIRARLHIACLCSCYDCRPRIIWSFTNIKSLFQASAVSSVQLDLSSSWRVDIKAVCIDWKRKHG